MADRREDLPETCIGPGFQFIKSPRKLLVRGKNESQPHERAHDFDVDGDCARTVEYGGKHGNAVLGKSVGRVAPATPT